MRHDGRWGRSRRGEGAKVRDPGGSVPRTLGYHLKGLLTEAMELWQAYHRAEAVDFATQAERLRRQVAYLRRDRPLTEPDNWRLQTCP